ncbi:glycosyltransferase family 8 protein [Zopfia rhizophila CBS 207.26]|uniref:Glycosyltransferase family 8 protein n=1 Tax=Zopfia rhizophila CBS 207.26 TaxID=1314779 RepID=A0A6A6DJ03_9PEZI|nr:glycosyltransferase family 8 protein [Zopfia rhizophila CBS 207.26]
MLPSFPRVASSSSLCFSVAYHQNVTNSYYLCNSLMILESLHRLGSKADGAMMYPKEWNVPADNGMNATCKSTILAQPRDRYDAELVPIQVPTFSHQEPTWKHSFTKLLAFNQTQYKRIINLDSDSTVLQLMVTAYGMDELFFLPSSPVAVPEPIGSLTSPISLLPIARHPAFRARMAVHRILHGNHSSSDFDMEIVNLYGNSCIMLPHSQYNLITGEFRLENHDAYLGSKEEQWNVTQVLEEAKFLHFSDWPYPKPWLKASGAETVKNQPKCQAAGDGVEACEERDTCRLSDVVTGNRRICGNT